MYPRELCEAILRGLEKSMVNDYIVEKQLQYLEKGKAYPVYDVPDDDEVISVASHDEARPSGLSPQMAREMEEFERDMPAPPRTEIDPEYTPSIPDRDAVPLADLEGPQEPPAPVVQAPMTPSNVKRRRPRVQEIKKGAWIRLTGPVFFFDAKHIALEC